MFLTFFSVVVVVEIVLIKVAIQILALGSELADTARGRWRKEITWAASALFSRGYSTYDKTLVPLIDFANHHPGAAGLTSPLERNFVAEGTREIYLSARETVYIPFTLRSEQCGRVAQPVEGDVIAGMPEGVPGFAGVAPAAVPR